MKNVAYGDEYVTYFDRMGAVFCRENVVGEKVIHLSPPYLLKKRSYAGSVEEYGIHGSECDLLDGSGRLLYTIRNLNEAGEFFRVIRHGDGREYLVFRRDLYGYSVFCMNTMEDFHFIPEKSFLGGETFIWTDVFYNKENGLLAVSGCFWACPCGILLVDFSQPLQGVGEWVDVQGQLEGGYDRYDDLFFLEWRGTDLVLRAFHGQREKEEVLILSEGDYGAWLYSYTRK